MCAAAFDFVAERGFIEASVDPHEILDWMSDYGRRRRAAAGEGDDAAAAEFDELHCEAEDRVVELKAAALGPAASVRADADVVAPPTRRERVAPRPEAAPAAQAAHSTRVRMADPDEAGRRESARRRAEAQAAAEADQADRDREDQEELRQLRERAAKATARRDAALAATARIEAAAKQAAAEAERARVDAEKRRVAQAAEDGERAAAQAEAAARNAASMAAKSKGVVDTVPAQARPTAHRPVVRGSAAPPAAPVAELPRWGCCSRRNLRTWRPSSRNSRRSRHPTQRSGPKPPPAFASPTSPWPSPPRCESPPRRNR